MSGYLCGLSFSVPLPQESSQLFFIAPHVALAMPTMSWWSARLRQRHICLFSLMFSIIITVREKIKYSLKSMQVIDAFRWHIYALFLFCFFNFSSYWKKVLSNGETSLLQTHRIPSLMFSLNYHICILFLCPSIGLSQRPDNHISVRYREISVIAPFAPERAQSGWKKGKKFDGKSFPNSASLFLLISADTGLF